MSNTPSSEAVGSIDSGSILAPNSLQQAQPNPLSIQNQIPYSNAAQQQQNSVQYLSQTIQSNSNLQPIANQGLCGGIPPNHPMVNTSYTNLPTVDNFRTNSYVSSASSFNNNGTNNYTPPRATRNNLDILRAYPPHVQSYASTSHPSSAAASSNPSHNQTYSNSPYPTLNPSHYQNYQNYAIRYRPDPEFESIFSEIKNNQIINEEHGYSKEFFQEWWYQAIGRGSGSAYYPSNSPSPALVQTMDGGRSRTIKKPTQMTQEVIDITSDDSDIEGVISNETNNVNKQDKPHNFPIAKYDTSVSQQYFTQNRYQITSKLYEYYNSTIFEDKLPKELEINWVNTLNRTAGKHFVENTRFIDRNSIKCWIQLSNKVVNTVDRLKNTLVHELCHLAAILINGDRSSSHEDSWKKWAQQASNTHPDLAIPIGHTYDK